MLNKMLKNNIHYKKKLVLIIISIILGFIFSQSRDITATSVNNGSIGYSVAKIPSEHEINPKNAFYDLKVQPKKQIRISARIYNASNKTIKVKSNIFTTFTNDNGQIGYTNQPKTFDKSLQNKPSDFIQIDQKDRVKKIAKKSSVVINATVRTPKNAQGVMLGSWYFQKEGSNTSKKTKGISISNKYTYAMALKLTSTKNPIQQPDLDILSVNPGLNNYRKVVYSKIQNNKPAMIKDMKLKSTVLSQKTGEKVFGTSKDNISMAPNSNFNFSTFANDDQLKPGKYILKLRASANNRTWDWTRVFSISDQQANQFNKQAKNDPKTPISIWWYFLAGFILLMLLILIIWIIVWRIVSKRAKK